MIFFHVYLLLLLNNFWHKANHNITHILKFSNQLGNIANILATASDGLSIAKLTKQSIREGWNGQRAGVYNCGRKIFYVLRGGAAVTARFGKVAKSIEKALVKRFCEKNFTEFLARVEKMVSVFLSSPAILNRFLR